VFFIIFITLLLLFHHHFYPNSAQKSKIYCSYALPALFLTNNNKRGTTMSDQKEIKIDIYPTVFAELNAANNLPADHETKSVIVKRLKHGHLRNLQRMNEEDQIHFLMSTLTGLSQADLDELDVEDSAKLSETIFGFMKRYAQIAKEMAR
jgi:hypothetical protein